MSTITLPWPSFLPGFRGYVVLVVTLRPLRVRAWRIAASPDAPLPPAEIVRALAAGTLVRVH